MQWQSRLLAAILVAIAGAAEAQPVDEGDDEPALPSGLGDADDDEPPVPAGLDEAASDEPAIAEQPADRSLPFELRGFVDVRGGLRARSDPDLSRPTLGEARLQLGVERSWTPLSSTARVVADLLFDPVVSDYEPHLETGRGAVDLREANLVASPFDGLDIRLGRQIVTWGTGDLVFINDLFPKDWTAFLAGRDIEYLKAPSDAVKLAAFHDLVNVDVVYTPVFDADRFPDRRRLSSWDPMQGRIAGADDPVPTQRPDRWFRDAEWAARAHRRLGRFELAAYGYRGFWKSPAGADPGSGSATFPALSVYGASARTPLGRGIANLEAGYYDSQGDRAGDDPLTRNDEARALVGYERELRPNLTLGAQYYVEWMLDYDGYRAGSPAGAPAADEMRHVLTTRLTLLSRSQTVTSSLFLFVSPSDRDAYLIPQVTYQLDDHWRLQTGANVFLGREDHTFFGQFENNTNVHAAARYAW
jgi:hypothetical protein